MVIKCKYCGTENNIDKQRIMYHTKECPIYKEFHHTGEVVMIQTLEEKKPETVKATVVVDVRFRVEKKSQYDPNYRWKEQYHKQEMEFADMNSVWEFVNTHKPNVPENADAYKVIVQVNYVQNMNERLAYATLDKLTEIK